MKHPPARRLLVSAGVAMLVALTAAAPARADDRKETVAGTGPEEAVPGGFGSWNDLFTVQAALNDAADRILSATDRPEVGGIVAAPEDGELRVYWRGPVPPEVRQAADSSGVPVQFLPATFTGAELAVEVERLGADPRVLTASPNVDGSGVSLTVGTATDVADVQALATLPATVTVGGRPELAYDRWNDITPYWGGARWVNLSAGSACSTGFGLIWQDRVRMLTAGHCGSNGNTARIGNAAEPVTAIINDVDPRDTQMLESPPGKTHAGRSYVGASLPGNNKSVRVSGGSVDYPGNYICTGGSYTGEHCSIKVIAVNVVFLGRAPMTYAAHASGFGNCVVAHGDSGGPVYSYSYLFHGTTYPAGVIYLEATARARGTITGGNFTGTTCTDYNGAVVSGSYEVWYAPVLGPVGGAYIGSLQFYGASLLTV